MVTGCLWQPNTRSYMSWSLWANFSQDVWACCATCQQAGQPRVTATPCLEAPLGCEMNKALCVPWSGQGEPRVSGSEHLPAPKEVTYILSLRQDHNCKSENINYTFIFLWFSFFCFSFHSRINFPVTGTFLMCQIHQCNERRDKCWRWADIWFCCSCLQPEETVTFTRITRLWKMAKMSPSTCPSAT